MGIAIMGKHNLRTDVSCCASAFHLCGYIPAPVMELMQHGGRKKARHVVVDGVRS